MLLLPLKGVDVEGWELTGRSLPTNKAGKQVSKPCLFSLCLTLVLSLKLASKNKNKKIRHWPPAIAVEQRSPACRYREH